VSFAEAGDTTVTHAANGGVKRVWGTVNARPARSAVTIALERALSAGCAAATCATSATTPTMPATTSSGGTRSHASRSVRRTRSTVAENGALSRVAKTTIAVKSRTAALRASSALTLRSVANESVGFAPMPTTTETMAESPSSVAAPMATMRALTREPAHSPATATITPANPANVNPITITITAAIAWRGAARLRPGGWAPGVDGSTRRRVTFMAPPASGEPPGRRTVQVRRT
jgi:uncharacterized protein with beta-barrel porin domain